MPKKPGRPPGAKNKVGQEQKEFIKGLLGETQEEFRNAFVYYAKHSAENQEDRSRFVNLSIELSKMIVPKPVEIDASVSSDDFKTILGLCSKYDDEQ